MSTVAQQAPEAVDLAAEVALLREQVAAIVDFFRLRDPGGTKDGTPAARMRALGWAGPVRS